MSQSRIDSSLRSRGLSRLTGVSSGDSYKNKSNVVSNKTRDLARRRLRYLKAREQKLGEKTHDEFREREKLYGDERGIRVWGQAFGGTGEQSARSGIDGYDFNTVGVSIGVDTGSLDKKIVMGAILTYADSDVDSSNSNSTQTNMQSYQAGLYGSYNFENDYFVNGTVIYGLNDITATRHNVGGTGSQATAEYDSEQLTLYAEIGKRLVLDNEVFLTPSFVTQYGHANFEDYIEHGASGANLTVKQGTINSLEIGPQVKAAIQRELDSGIIVIPEATIGYRYDVVQDTMNSNSFFEGTNTGGAGGQEFNLKGFEPQAHSVNLGTGVELGTEDWQVKANYGYELKEDFAAHSGLLRVNYIF